MNSPNHPTLDTHPGLLLHDIARLFRYCFGQRLRDLGLSEPQWRALGTVNKFPGISQTQLAQLLGIGKAPLGKLIDRLEGEGLMRRVPAPGDRRVKCLEISPAGQPVCQQLVERHEQFRKTYLRGLSARRRETLEGTLRTLYRRLSEQSSDEPISLQTESLNLMHLISGVSRLNSRHFDQQLKQLGFTRSQWLVMTAIGRSEGWQQSRLAREMNMGKAALGVLVDELEAGNWVERRVHPQDRRARTLHLTASCKRRLHSLGESFDRLHRSALGDVAEPEQRELSESLATIRHQLKRIAAAGEDVKREAGT